MKLLCQREYALCVRDGEKYRDAPEDLEVLRVMVPDCDMDE